MQLVCPKASCNPLFGYTRPLPAPSNTACRVCGVVWFFLSSLSSGIYTLVKLLGRKSDVWKKAEAGGAAGWVNVKHSLLICGKFLIQGPFAPCPAGSGVGKYCQRSHGGHLVSEELLGKSLSQELLGFGNAQRRGPCAAHAANSDPGWAFQDIREGFCKGVAAKISCVRARWQRHSHTLVTFKWELGKIYQKLGKCWLVREEKCFVARAGEQLSWQNSALSTPVTPEFLLCWGCIQDAKSNRFGAVEQNGTDL